MDEQATERITDQATAQRIIGARIREFREAAGLSQTELARRVYVSRQTVGNWESGRTLADVQSLVLLCDSKGDSPLLNHARRRRTAVPEQQVMIMPSKVS